MAPTRKEAKKAAKSEHPVSAAAPAPASSEYNDAEFISPHCLSAACSDPSIPDSYDEYCSSFANSSPGLKFFLVHDDGTIVEDEEKPSAAPVIDATINPNEKSSQVNQSGCPLPLRDGPSQPKGTKGKDKPSAKKKANGPVLTATDLERYLFPFLRESEDGEQSAPLHIDYAAQQAKTEKIVKFFKDNTSDKHFIEIPIKPLTGKENWREWLVAMQLLFIQHGVWEVVTREAMPLPQSHPLSHWYQRMRNCAVALIYLNVTDAARNTTCFLHACMENDPDILLSNLYSHCCEGQTGFSRPGVHVQQQSSGHSHK